MDCLKVHFENGGNTYVNVTFVFNQVHPPSGGECSHLLCGECIQMSAGIFSLFVFCTLKRGSEL